MTTGEIRRVLILGSTGRIGRLALDRALVDGHDVVILVREAGLIEPRDRLEVVRGDIRDREAVQRAVRGTAAVIVAVGARSNSLEDELALESGMRNVVTAMEVEGVLRLVTLSGAAVESPGDRKPMVDRAASAVVRRLARHVVGAKQREFEVFANSSLDWTALRPALVSDGPARGYRLDLRLTPGARVTREDVARALVDQLTDSRFLRTAPFVLPAPRG